MKKILALILALVMVLSLAACGGNADAPAADAPAADAPAAQPDAGEAVQLPVPYPEKTVKIGVEIYDPTDSETLTMQAYFEELVKDGLNVEFIYSEAIASAEAEFQFIDDCYNAGCKGIIGFYNVAMGETVQKCVDYGMYYWGAAIDSQEVIDKFQDNPYVLDAIGYGNGDYEGGYALGEYFGELGAKKVIYASGGAAFGVPMFVNRAEGFKAAAEKYGIEYIEVAGFPGDAFFADQAAALSEDVDGVAASFNGLDFWAQPIAVAGKTETCPTTWPWVKPSRSVSTTACTTGALPLTARKSSTSSRITPTFSMPSATAMATTRAATLWASTLVSWVPRRSSTLPAVQHLAFPCL